MSYRRWLLALVFVGFCSLVQADSTSASSVIGKITISGNKNISKEKIATQIKSRPGQTYYRASVNEDIKKIYSLGYFKNIEAETKTLPTGELEVIYKVEEKPLVKQLIIKGNRRIRKKKIEDALGIKEGGFFDEFALKEAQRTIKDMYIQKGYSQAEVSYRVDLDKAANKAVVEFDIREEKPFRVKKVIILGNLSFSDKRIIKLMKTRPAWLLRRGVFKVDTLKDDIERITDFYQTQGFSDVKVGYKIDRDLHRGFVFVTININEGQKYFIGSVNIEGNKNVSLADIRKALKVKPGSVYNKNLIKAQAFDIQQVYFDRGYIFARIVPLSAVDPATHKVDVTYKIEENDVAYVERIKITGNTKTKDKVIRRQLRIRPGDKFSGEKIRRSRKRLQNLGIFEDISFDDEPTETPNHENLVVKVKEAKTGSLSFGGGYSSVDAFVGFIELQQKNFDWTNFPTFTGGGQNLSLYMQTGSTIEEYVLSFTNPWIFDRPISFGFDAYRKEHDREENSGYGYDETRKGGRIRFGKEFNDNLGGTIAYRFETVDISDVADDASSELKKEIGSNDISSLEFSLDYDTRDSRGFTHEGILFSNSFELAGDYLGGDKDFVKFYSRLSKYFPFPKDAVVEAKVRVGFAKAIGNSDYVPIYERFFAGGAYTIRGYEERAVGPVDPSNGDPLGGEALFVANIEYTYPLGDYLRLAAFFDTGNVWRKYNDFLSGSLKSGIGFGIRVKTPLGPIKVDYGIPLNKAQGEESKGSGRFHFSMSNQF